MKAPTIIENAHVLCVRFSVAKFQPRRYCKPKFAHSQPKFAEKRIFGSLHKPSVRILGELVCMSTITDNISRLLDEKRIPKGAFYSAVGISSTAFSKWKLGKSKPTLENLYTIAEYLGVSIGAITGETKTAATQTDDGLSQNQKRLIQLVSSLDDDLCAYLIQKAQDLIDFQQFRDARQ